MSLMKVHILNCPFQEMSMVETVLENKDHK